MAAQKIALQLRIAEEFSEFPGGRYRTDGDYSGQEFREDHLIPRLRGAISDDTVLEAVVDGVAGYGSSFLEEAFGGLVREGIFDHKEIRSYLAIAAETVAFQVHKIESEQYIEDAIGYTAPRRRAVA